MKRNFFLQLIIFSFCLTMAGGGWLSAAPVPAPEAKTWAESRGNALLEAFNEPRLNIKYQKLDKMLLDYVDLDYISRFVIGKHWRQMNAVQQEKYRQLFKRYALALYKSFPLSFGSRLSFRIGRIFQSGEATVVQTLISLPDKKTVENKEEIMVEFFISRKNNQPKIIDLKLGESSLILSYRSRFYEMVSEADNDIDWFLEDFEMITVSAERNSQLKLQSWMDGQTK